MHSEGDRVTDVTHRSGRLPADTGDDLWSIAVKLAITALDPMTAGEAEVVLRRNVCAARWMISKKDL